MTKEEVKELLDYAIECRRRVKEQLCKMNPLEFSDVDLGYTDIETDEEHIIYLPESASETLIPDKQLISGYAYAVGKSVDGKVGIYRLENKLIEGTGKFSYRNIEGLSHSPKSVKDSLNAAYNYFGDHAYMMSKKDHLNYDYTLFYNDLQNRKVSDEISVAETVALFSALLDKPVTAATIIVGRVVMSGSMAELNTDLNEIFVTSSNAGAKRILLPEDIREKYEQLPIDLKRSMDAVFYDTPFEAARKALEV